MRLPYVPTPPIPANAEEAAIIEKTLERRGDEGLIPLDLTLLHSPAITNGWNSFMGAIRTKTSISADLRELAICRVAVLNQAHFEWIQHYPLALEAGVSREGLKTIRDGTPGDLNEKQIAVLNFTTASTKDGHVADVVFEELKKHFSNKEIVEIVATVAAYNCVSRFLIALDVAEGNSVSVADYPMI